MPAGQDDEAQRQIHLSEGRLREAVRVSAIGIFDHDHLADTIYWSPEQRAIYGIGADEPVTLELFIGLVHPDDVDGTGEAVRRAHDPAGDGRFDVDHRIVRRDGEVRWVDTRSQTFFADVDGRRRPVRTVGAIIDITERRLVDLQMRRQADALRVSEEQFRSLLEATPILAVINGPDGRIIFANRSIGELVGRPHRELAGQYWRDVCGVFPEDRWWTDELRQGRLVETYEGRARDRNGGVRQIAWTNAFLPAGPEQPITIASLGIDVTEQRRVEAARAQAEQDRLSLMEALLTAEETERRRLAEALHDDTVQEITASLLALDAAVRGEAPAHALERARATIAAALERARRLMFEVSPAALETVGLGSAIAAFCRQIGTDSGLTVVVEVPDGRYPRAVEELCYRTVRECVINTRKHARATNLTVTVDHVDDRLVGVVCDDGVGFDAGAAIRNAGALHLGVQAMADRIRIVHGQFDIRSAPGQGTRVEFRIPTRRLDGDRPVDAATSAG